MVVIRGCRRLEEEAEAGGLRTLPGWLWFSGVVGAQVLESRWWPTGGRRAGPSVPAAWLQAQSFELAPLSSHVGSTSEGLRQDPADHRLLERWQLGSAEVKNLSHLLGFRFWLPFSGLCASVCHVKWDNERSPWSCRGDKGVCQCQLLWPWPFLRAGGNM